MASEFDRSKAGIIANMLALELGRRYRRFDGWQHVRLLPQEVPADLANAFDLLVGRQAFELRFPDSEQNRLRMLRFLLAEHLDEMPRDELLAFFNPYASEGEIVVPTWSEHVVVG